VNFLELWLGNEPKSGTLNGRVPEKNVLAICVELDIINPYTGWSPPNWLDLAKQPAPVRSVASPS